MRKPVRTPRRRSGFTLAELMIVVVVLGIIGSLLTTVLLRQQRFHRAVANIADSRARMRDVATILPTDLRSISTAGEDILTMDVNSIQFRAFIGAAVLCRFASATVIEVPPRVMASGNVLTSWINPPAPGDVVYIYDDGATAGNSDDSWTQVAITDTVSAADATWCPTTTVPPFTTAADNGARRYRFTLGSAISQVTHTIGNPMRFAREVRYSAYQAADAQWYVGYEKCTPNAIDPSLPGACANREVLAGPIRPVTTDTLTSGLFFVYYDQTGTRITDPAEAALIARISVGIRTTSESLRQATASNKTFASGDSLRFTVGIRNRI